MKLQKTTVLKLTMTRSDNCDKPCPWLQFCVSKGCDETEVCLECIISDKIDKAEEPKGTLKIEKLA